MPTIEQLFGHDLSYFSEDHVEKVFGTLHEGPLEGVANECEVVASAPPAMTIEVRTGTFVTGGCFARVSAQLPVLVIGAADPINPRIDRIVCRRDNATNQVTVYVLAGVAAGVPVAPVLTRVGGVWEISLAQVYVGAAVVVINAADITDERPDYSVCGYALGKATVLVERQPYVWVPASQFEIGTGAPTYGVKGGAGWAQGLIAWELRDTFLDGLNSVAIPVPENWKSGTVAVSVIFFVPAGAGAAEIEVQSAAHSLAIPANPDGNKDNTDAWAQAVSGDLEKVTSPTALIVAANTDFMSFTFARDATADPPDTSINAFMFCGLLLEYTAEY